jgi:hypothetical protein
MALIAAAPSRGRKLQRTIMAQSYWPDARD